MHLSAIWKMVLQCVRVQWKLSLRFSFLSVPAAISKESFSFCSFPSQAFERFGFLNLFFSLVLHKTLSSAVLLCPVKPLFSFLFFHDLDFSFFSFSCFFFSYHCVFYVLKLVEHNDDIRVVFVITDHQLLRAFLGGTVHLLCDWLLHL